MKSISNIFRDCLVFVGLVAIAAWGQVLGPPAVLKVAEWPLQPVFNTDGRAPFTTVDGSLCARTTQEVEVGTEAGGGAGAQSVHLYFAIDDEFLSLPENRSLLERSEARAYLRVEYYSNGKSNDFVTVDYDSIRHAYDTTARHLKPNQPGWHRHTFVLWNPRFTKRQNKRADFRITNCGDGDELVRKVELFLTPEQAGVAKPVISVSKLNWGSGCADPVVRFLVENTSSESRDCKARLLRMNPREQTVNFDPNLKSIEFEQGLHLSANQRKEISIDIGKLSPGTHVLTLEILDGTTEELLFSAARQYMIPEGLEIALDHPRYHSTLFPTDGLKTIAGHVGIRDDLPVDGSLLISLVGADGAKITSRTVDRPERKVPFTFDGESLAVGDYTIQARLLNKQSTQIALAEHQVRKVGPGPVDVRIRDDNVLLVNGKPFFPRGVYLSGDIDESRQVADLGFNIMMAGAALAISEKGLALANERNLWYTTFCGDSAEGIAKQMPTYGNCPRLLGWYNIDEPGINFIAPELFREVYSALLGHDPYRFVFTAFHLPPTFERFFDGVDIVMVDPYEIRSEGSNDLTVVATTVDLARKAAGDQKPVWLIPQGFGHMQPEWNRLPTLWEERCMVFLGVVHGAKGIFFYNYQAAYPENLKGVFSLGNDAHLAEAAKHINRELEILEPALVGGGKELEVAVDCPRKLHCLAKCWDDDFCLIAVNPYDAYLEASFRFPGIEKLSTVRLLFGDGERPVSGERFVDFFRPYAVHAYKIN